MRFEMNCLENNILRLERTLKYSQMIDCGGLNVNSIYSFLPLSSVVDSIQKVSEQFQLLKAYTSQLTIQ